MNKSIAGFAARPLVYSLMIGTTCLLAGSCTRGAAGPETYPVGGVVMMDGQPVQDATVSFDPVGGTARALGAQAVTDDDGRFSMQTHIGNNQFQAGLRPGQYGVTIIKLQQATEMRGRPRDLLPKKYGSADTSGLAATVKAEPNEFEFTLK